MPNDVRLYEGEAQPKDVRLREAAPAVAVGYQYSDGLVCIQVVG